MKRDYIFCVWCGSTGGFANALFIKSKDNNAIVECQWCSANINFAGSN